MSTLAGDSRRSLRRAGIKYLAVSLLAVSILVAAVAAGLYRIAVDRQGTNQADDLSQHLRADVSRIDEHWARETQRIRGALEAARIAEALPAREAAFATFFEHNATLYPRLGHAVLAGDRLLAQHGLAEPVAAGLSGASGWSYDPAARALFRLVAVPIALAPGEEGRLVVAWPVDSAVLVEMLHEDAAIELLWQGRVLARADGGHARRDVGAKRELVRSIDWSEGAGEQPILRLHVLPERLFAPLDLVLGVAMLLAVFVALIWRTLGRWVAGILDRLHWLEQAVLVFGREGRVSEAVRGQLARAEPGRGDELASAVDALQGLMETVDRERRETQAHLEQLLSISVVQAAFSQLESAPDFFTMMLQRAVLTCHGEHGLLAEYRAEGPAETRLTVLAATPLGGDAASCLGAWPGGDLAALPSLELALARGAVQRMHECPADAAFAVPLKSDERVRGLLLVFGVRDEAALRANAMLWNTCGHLIEATRGEIERRKLLGELLLAEQVFSHSSEAIVITDAECRIIRINPAFSRLTGYAAEEAIGQNPRILQSGRHGQAFYAAMWRDINTKGHWSGELWDRRKDGSIYPKWLSINVLRDAASGGVRHYLGMFSDISVLKESQRKLEHLAYHDPLTELPNRAYVAERVGGILEQARRRGRMVAMMMIDLDRFKHINDSLGHLVGDRLLRALAQRLPPLVRDHDVVARLGGDEFIIVLADVENRAIVERVAQKVQGALGAPVEFDAYSLHVTPSIGIAVFPGDGEDEASLLREADAAMYYAKDGGRNQVRFFSAFMDEEARERLDIEQGLREALGKGELELHYQPQVSADGQRVCGFEALMRWRHPLLGWISPSRFIPIAEETGVIIEIGEWALRTAAAQASQWLANGWPEFTMSVNLSAQQFACETLTTTISRVLADAGLPPRNLEIEITESCLVQDPQLVGEQLQALRGLGISIAVDDFGTGYSSLSYLKNFALDRLKIDRSFVTDVISDPSAAAITSAIMSLAAVLKLETVAEGVETAGQLAFMRRAGCDCIQGFYYSKPLPAALIPDFVRRHTRVLAL